MISFWLKALPNNEQPHPYHIDTNGNVLLQDFWLGNPAGLVGFQADLATQRVGLLTQAFLADPQAAVGMYPVFVRDGGGVFVEEIPVATVVELADEHPERAVLAEPEMAEAIQQWCEWTGTDFTTLPDDEDFAAAVTVLLRADLLRWREPVERYGPGMRSEAIARAAVVLEAGAILADQRRMRIHLATRRVADVVAEHLGYPTGYEGQADLLARRIHEGTPFAKL